MTLSYDANRISAVTAWKRSRDFLFHSGVSSGVTLDCNVIPRKIFHNSGLTILYTTNLCIGLLVYFNWKVLTVLLLLLFDGAVVYWMVLNKTRGIDYPSYDYRRPRWCPLLCSKVVATCIPHFRYIDHITATLRDDFHWLPIRQRVMYKVCTIVYKCLHAAAPPYLSELCIPVSMHQRWTSFPAFSNIWWSARAKDVNVNIRTSQFRRLRT